MKHLIRLLAMPLAFGLVPHTAIADDDDDDDDSRDFVAEMVQLNSSGVYAEVELELINGRTLKVEIEASGLEPGKPHPQHIHGIDNPVKNSTCPGLDAVAIGVGIKSRAGGILYRLIDTVDVLRVRLAGLQSGRLDFNFQGPAVDEFEFHFGVDAGTVQLHHLGNELSAVVVIVIVVGDSRVWYKSESQRHG